MGTIFLFIKNIKNKLLKVILKINYYKYNNYYKLLFIFLLTDTYSPIIYCYNIIKQNGIRKIENIELILDANMMN